MNRSLERALLLPAFAIGAAGLMMVHLARYRDASWAVVLVGLVPLAAAWIPHVVLVRRRLPADPLILPLVMLLTALGLIAIYRLSPGLLLRQAAWVTIGLGILTLLLFTRGIRRLTRYKYLIGTVAVVLLGVALVAGVDVGGTRQWIQVGAFTFEPSEAVKVLLVIFLAAYLSDRRPLLEMVGPSLTARYAGPMLLLGSMVMALLVAQRDLGAGLLLFTVALLVVYAATGRRRHLFGGFALLLAAAVVMTRLFPHVQTRMAGWWNPWADLQGIGYQVAQGLFALGSGGLSGSGIGLGHPEVLPAGATDLVFAVIGEELGFAGGLAVVLASLLLVSRGMRLAVRAGTWFDALLAGGLATILGVQAILILGGILRLLPLTGITLPFVSYGGNSILSSFFIAGLLLRIEPAWSPDPGLPPVRRHLRGIAVALTAFFVVIAGALGWWQLMRGTVLAAHPANPRLVFAEQEVVRGTIYDRLLRPLVDTDTEAEGRLVRRYLYGRMLAHLTGYRSLRYGKAGVEAAYDADLLAVGRRAFLEEARFRLLGRKPRGEDLVLTIDLDLQRAAAEALGTARGAIVAVDPRSGAILASVASPAFDPNRVDDLLPALRTSPDSPLLDRAAQATYPPGSAFKVVTLAAGLTSGAVTMESTFECPGYIYIRKTKVTDFEGRAHGTVTMRQALVRSCNIAFIQAGLRIGGDALRRTARALGVGRPPAYELPAAAGHLPSPMEAAGEGVGQAAFGQGSLAVSPLQMAMIAAAIGNGGMLYQPYLVAEVRNATGRVVRAHRPVGRRALQPEVAAQVAAAMVDVVREGTGVAARLREVTVAGKTGTAENPAGRTHAWFIAFLPAEAPRLALAVIVEHGGVGGEMAAPIARRVLQAALGLSFMTAR